LHAYDATDVSRELWNSNQNQARDGLGQFAKFGQPIIADGKVFVPTFSNAVVAYGLLGTPPAAPSNLNFAIDFNALNQVGLTWDDHSDNETGFRIERSLDGVNFTEIATVGANVTRYSDTNVSPFTYYYYRVRSYNAFGDSADSGMAGYYVL
jgi:titin